MPSSSHSAWLAATLTWSAHSFTRSNMTAPCGSEHLRVAHLVEPLVTHDDGSECECPAYALRPTSSIPTTISSPASQRARSTRRPGAFALSARATAAPEPRQRRGRIVGVEPTPSGCASEAGGAAGASSTSATSIVSPRPVPRAAPRRTESPVRIEAGVAEYGAIGATVAAKTAGVLDAIGH